MAALAARARFKLRFPPCLLEQKCGIRPQLTDTSEKEWTIVQIHYNRRPRNFSSIRSNASFCQSTGKYDPVITCAERNLPYEGQTARMVQERTFVEVAHAKILHGRTRDWVRWIQTYPDKIINHPWTRDQLAKRYTVLRERRKAKKLTIARYKELWKSLMASSQAPYVSSDATSFPQNPSPSQPLEGALKPRTPEEGKVAPLLARTDLLITRHVEWANILVGFEQENRYVIVDPRQALALVGFVTEKSHWLFRQFLRTRRPFIAEIMDAAGTVLFMVRRPIWFINSTIFAEIDGKVVGFVKRRWHLWRRNYDLYIGNKQFAVVENPGLWNWTFTLKDENGRVLAEVDRHFRGFGYEMLTDAGQYAMRFGDVAPAYQPSPGAHTLTAEKASPSELQGINVKSETETDTFTVDRPLSLLERAVTLALAVSLDNDYFSRHGGGWFLPIPFMGSEE